MKSNIVLVGMPGSGKSSLGVALSKALGMDFVDTDQVIQARYGDQLQRILDAHGVDAFLKLEEELVVSLDYAHTVIATGGSVIYGERAMAHLRAQGTIVYIELPYAVIERRITNLATRGVTLRAGQTLRDLYDERIPLYEQGCELRFAPGEKDDIETSVAQLCRRLQSMV